MWLSEIQGLSRCADKLDSYRMMTNAQVEHHRKLDMILECIDCGIDRPRDIAKELAIDTNSIYRLIGVLLTNRKIRAVMVNKQQKRYERNRHV